MQKKQKKEKKRKEQNKVVTLFGLNFIIECDIDDKPIIVKTILINIIYQNIDIDQLSWLLQRAGVKFR